MWQLLHNYRVYCVCHYKKLQIFPVSGQLFLGCNILTFSPSVICYVPRRQSGMKKILCSAQDNAKKQVVYLHYLKKVGIKSTKGKRKYKFFVTNVKNSHGTVIHITNIHSLTKITVQWVALSPQLTVIWIFSYVNVIIL